MRKKAGTTVPALPAFSPSAPQRLQKLPPQSQHLAHMIVGHHVPLHHGVKGTNVQDPRAVGLQPPPVLAVAPPGPPHAAENLHLGYQRLGLPLTHAVALQLLALPPQVEQQPLVGE